MVKIICESCDGEFEVHPYRIKTARFCSQKCRAAKAVKTCEFCKKKFEVRPSEKNQRFCSKECYGGKITLVCNWCECNFKVKRSRRFRARFCSYECRGNWNSIYRRGKNHSCWLGNDSPYGIEFNDRLKETIRTRDGRRCQLCGIGENGRRLDVHHIDYDKQNNEPSNLVALCHSCHAKTGKDRQDWRQCFEEMAVEWT